MGQMLVYLPSLSFMALLAGIFFLQLDDALLPSPPLETQASDIVWERYMPNGRLIRLSTPLLKQQADGSVLFTNARLENNDLQNAVLFGRRGVADSAYQSITLHEAGGELTSAQNGKATLSVAMLQYDLKRFRLQGEKIHIRWQNSQIKGDKFTWDQARIRLHGNVNALYLAD